MLGWVLAGFAGAVLAAGVLGLSSVLLRVALGFSEVPAPSQLAYVLTAATAFQSVLLLAAFWQGGRAAAGDHCAGLGVRPIRHGGRVALLCIVMVIWLLTFILLAEAFPALRAFVKSVTPDMLAGLGGGGPIIVVLRIVLVTILAPVSEELFFRGWLWEAFRRRGHTVTMTACMTVLPWLLLHGIDSPGRIVFLIPAAVVFSLARQQGGSVLASLSVHLTNNMTAVFMQALGTWFGQPS